MKRQGISTKGIAISSQLMNLLTVPEPHGLRSDHRPPARNLQANFQRLVLGLLTLGLVSCAPAKPPATPSPTVEATPIATPTPSIKPSVSPSPKASTSSSRDNSAPVDNYVEPEQSTGGGDVEEQEPPVQKTKAVEPPQEKPQRTENPEKPAPAIEPDLPARAPQPTEVAPAPPIPKAPAAPAQSDDPEPPPS